MSLEDFSREVMGKPPKNRDLIDRAIYTDEDGCSYDRQVMVTRLPLGIGLAFFAGLLLVGWASDDPVWIEMIGRLKGLFGLF